MSFLIAISVGLLELDSPVSMKDTPRCLPMYSTIPFCALPSPDQRPCELQSATRRTRGAALQINPYRYNWHLTGDIIAEAMQIVENICSVKLTRLVAFATIGGQLPVSALESCVPSCCQGIREGGMGHGGNLATGSPGLSRLASDKRRQADGGTPYSAVAHRDVCAALSSPTRVAYHAAAVVPAARQFLSGATVWHRGTARTCGHWDESL